MMNPRDEERCREDELRAESYIPTLQQMDAVLKFLPIFEQEDFVVSWPDETGGGSPFHDFEAEEIGQFAKAVWDNGLMVVYDWGEFAEEARRYYEEPERLANVDIQALRKLITINVRQDRFCDGHLAEAVEDGHITAILRRLKKLRDEVS